MTSVSELIKTLREKTGAGMLDCKKALAESNNDIEQAIDWLRKKGLSVANKKSDRVIAEGLVAVASNNNHAVLLEVNSETDFVARNETFQSFVKSLANLSLNLTTKNTAEDLKALNFGNGKTVADELVSQIATIGENLGIRRLQVLDVQNKHVALYVHNAIAENLGKMGVAVVFNKAPKNAEVAKQIAMHIAATSPKALNINDLDPQLVEREMAIQKDLAKQSGKPDNIIEKMLEGRLSKFYQEVVLLKQSFVINPDLTVEKVLQENDCSIVEYKLFVLGEGIEKQVVDFASEVNSISKA